MENFDPKEYRDNLAGLIKSTPDKQERREILRANSDTTTYERAKEIHLEDIQTLEGREILPIKEIVERIKHSSYLQEQFWGKTYTDGKIRKWSQQSLEKSVTTSIANYLTRKGRSEEAAGLYEREAQTDTDLFHDDERHGNFWFRSGCIRERLGDFNKAIEDYKNYYDRCREALELSIEIESRMSEKSIKGVGYVSPISSLNGYLDSIVFTLGRCYTLIGDKNKSKELFEKRALELGAAMSPDYEVLAQLLILAGNEDKAKEILSPLFTTHWSSAGPGRQYKRPVEEVIKDMHSLLRSKGYEQDAETEEWVWKKAS